MIARCKPVGRGYRLLTEFAVTGARAQPLLVSLRSVFEFAGIRWRVVEVVA